MPPKKGKKTKKATVDKSTKQTVRQSVIVNVNTKDSSKPKKKRQTSTVKSFTKGMTYMAGTPYKTSVFPIMQHNILSQQPVQQPVFQSDLVNRVSALENLQRSILSDEQQARNIVTPLATQSPTAMKPIGTPNTPELLRDNSTPTMMKTPDVVKDTLNQIDESRQQDVMDIRDIMKASQGLKTPPASTAYDNKLFGDEEDQSPTRPTPLPKLQLDRSPYELRSQDEAGPSTSASTLPLSDQFKDIEDKQVEKVKKKKTKKGKEPAVQEKTEANTAPLYRKPKNPDETGTVTQLVPIIEQWIQEDSKKAQKQTRTRIPKLPQPSAEESQPSK